MTTQTKTKSLSDERTRSKTKQQILTVAELMKQKADKITFDTRGMLSCFDLSALPKKIVSYDDTDNENNGDHKTTTSEDERQRRIHNVAVINQTSESPFTMTS